MDSANSKVTTDSIARPGFVSYMVWFCITLFYCYQYILRVLPNIIMPDLMQDFAIGASEFGSFAGIYYIGYIVIHVPVGILLARFGSKNILPTAIVLTSIGTAPVIYSDSWQLVLAGRLLTGIGSSAAIVGALQIYRIIFPHSFTRMLGIMVSLSLITVVYAGGPLAKLIMFAGLESTINLIIYSGLFLAVATYILMPKLERKASNQSLIKESISVFLNRKLLFASIFAGMMVGPLEGFADAWGSAFLMQVFSMDKIAADDTVLSIFLGMCLGCLILPYFADKYKAHYAMTIFAAIIMITCFAYMLSLEVPEDNVYYLCLIVGFFCSYQVIIISKISTFVAPEKSGIAASVVNMIIMAFGWVFHNSIGYALSLQWQGEVVGDARIYSSQAFANSLSIIPLAMIVAIVGIFIISRIDRKGELKPI